jgi:endonuclease-3
MVELTIEEIQKIIKPCGLAPTKAKNIWHLSKILIDKHKGKVPCSFAALEALPGVGHKTASVVMAQAFHKPALPIDTHIFRCARRWGLSKGKTVEKVEKDLKRLFPKKEWIKLHLQIIYFARKYCPARSKHFNCPICCNIKT